MSKHVLNEAELTQFMLILHLSAETITKAAAGDYNALIAVRKAHGKRGFVKWR